LYLHKYSQRLGSVPNSVPIGVLALDAYPVTDNDRFQFQFTRILSAVVAVVVIATVPRKVICEVLPELTTVRAVRALKPDQASSARPVRLRGVVTVLSGWKSSFFFHDGTSGISVDRTNDSPELEPGELVEIRGVTGPGLFAPIVIANNVTVLGRGKLPAARLFNSADLVGGKEDSQWIAVRGIVRSAIAKPSWGRSVLFLEIDIGGGNIVVARVHDFSHASFDRLPAATVTVRGVCGTVFNDKRQFVGLRLFVASLDDVKIEMPAPTEPFDIPLRSLGSLLQFEDHQGSINRIKVQGVVTYSEPGQGLYIQDGTQGIFVQSGQSTPVVAGSQVEAVGYPAVGRYSPKLDNAVFRAAGAARPVSPLAQTAAGMIVMNDGFSSAPYDSVLVQVKGHLIEEVPGREEDLLLLQDDTSVFTARLSRSGQNHRALVTGSLVSVTGVCAANADEAHEARSFEILLRSPADLVILENAPWWTPAHAAWVVALLVLVVVGMFGWLAVVGRQASLRELTVSDPLTGLYNRRGFLLLAEQQWRLALRGKMSFLLFYIDVDRFKEINDSLGHKEGDLALQAVANVLRECFRKADILGRLGGDEFAVTAIDAPDNSRAALEERLARTVQQSNAKAGRRFQLSLSVGILSCDKSLGALPIEDLLAQADALMYQQKRDRKDQGI
jgi:diguanylate cyclase (GGDEF)-like protein